MSGVEVSFRWSEFARLVERYSSAVEELGPMVYRSREAAEFMLERIHPDPEVRQVASHFARALGELAGQADGLSRELDLLAERVGQAGASYLEMEESVTLRGLLDGSLTKDELQRILASADSPPGQMLLGAAGFGTPALLLAHLLKSGRKPGDAGILSGGMGAVLQAAGFRQRQRPVEVKSSKPARPHRRRLDEGAAAYLHEGLEIAKEEARPWEAQERSAAVVERLRQEGAPDVLVVYLPGSADLTDLASNNPNGVIGLGDALYGRSAAMRSGVEEALQQAGHRPGEPVVLAGHSQGGMHAANLGADPEFVSRYSVRAVYTEGSPVGATALDPRVLGVHVENLGDSVPALEGQDNPRGTQRTTLTAPIDYPDAGHAPGMPPEHALSEYGRAAQHMDLRTGSLAEQSAKLRLASLLEGDGGGGTGSGRPAPLTAFEIGQKRDAPPPHESWSWGGGGSARNSRGN